MTTTRRRFLQLVGTGAAASLTGGPLLRALADSSVRSDDYFILIHQAGGWDVMLWSDPRNQEAGLIDPPTTAVCNKNGITGWVDEAIGNGLVSFKPLVRGNYQYGPAMGSLVDLYDRLTVINGIAMNTVSHTDGTFFSSTGRRLAGGKPVASSIDTMLANEWGRTDLMPSVSLNFPSTFLGKGLDGRVAPLRVSDVGVVAKSLYRSPIHLAAEDRDAVTAILTEEAAELAENAYAPAVPQGMALQYGALRRMMGSDTGQLFDAVKLKAAHPTFNYNASFQATAALNASFAIEAIKRRAVRCVSFQTASCDTHFANYSNHPMILQQTFEVIANLVREMDVTNFEGSNDKLSDRVHILVISEFCRTPQINLTQGRDHYPNNSALIISPKFKGNYRYGSTDAEQLLPQPAGNFSDGNRAIAPADVLATFLGAFGTDPRKYMRDGEVVRALLK